MDGRWKLQVAVGLVLAAAGAVLTVRPFSSLSVLVWMVAVALAATGVASVLAGRVAGSRSLVVVGAGWLAAAVAALAWPTITAGGLALVVGVAMVGGGALDVVRGVRGGASERFPAIVGGAASLVFGVLALAWPDVTLLVVAVAFGARTVLFGLRMAWTSARDRPTSEGREAPGEPAASPAELAGPLRRAGHLVGVSAALVVALVLAGLSVALHRTTGTVDAFYDTPDDLPIAPGALLHAEPFTRGMPADAVAHRILYTTTRDEGAPGPVVASALVVVPADADGPVPVVAWAHGTTGIARRCAPTVMPTGLEAGAFFSLDRVLAEGWGLVATDYVGLGTEGPHPYLIGQGQARSVLDAVRAARQLDAVDLTDQTVVWGHSQGGGAALWTAQIAPTYAPDVPLDGVAALAPASDLAGFVGNLETMTGGSIFAGYVVSAYADAYDDLDLDHLVRPTARPAFDRAVRRCLDGTVLASALTSVAAGMDVFHPDLEDRLLPYLRANTPTGPFEAPLLVAQGEDDSIVVAEVQRRYVERLCAQGRAIELRTYPGLDHVPLVEPGSPAISELVGWTRARFDGAPTPERCTTG